MSIEAACSSHADPRAAAAELRAQVRGNPRFVAFFASPRYSPGELGAALAAAFPGVRSVGCSTAGELTTGKMLSHSVALLSLDSDELDSVHVERVELDAGPDAVRGALDRLAAPTDLPIAALDASRYVGIALHDGLSGAEERVMAALSSATNVPFIGGSAGDDRAFVATHVFTDFVPATGTSALALLQPKHPYRVLKTQSFDVLEQSLRVTDVDEATRTVRAFDGEPAARAYARVLNLPVEALEDHFQSHPLGLLGDGEPFVRSPQRLDGDHVVFYCRVSAGMQLQVLSARDIVADTRRDFEQAVAALGGCRGVLNFHCILRTIELEQNGQCEAYASLFGAVPLAGFSTYGESYVGHINQTSTIILFK